MSALTPPRGPADMPVAVVTGIDEFLRDALVGPMMLDRPRAVELRYTVDPREGRLRRLVVGRDGVREDVMIDLDHPCVSCAMRADTIPTLARLAEDPRVDAVLLSPPIAADPLVVCDALAEHRSGWRIASAVTVLAAPAARHDLLDDDTLAERGLNWADSDGRSVGEALAAQIEYADVIVADGVQEVAGEPGLELVSHLLSADQVLVRSVHDLEAAAVLDPGRTREPGRRRRDPRRVAPGSGPGRHGTWTLDLASERPLHPQRLLEGIEDLGSGRLRGRGRFWVPDRPSTICQWDGAGGQVSVGAVADSGRRLPTTRLVVTGIAAADATRVRDAFAACLLTEEEWAAGLGAWLGAEDVLAPWLGDRRAELPRSA